MNQPKIKSEKEQEWIQLTAPADVGVRPERFWIRPERIESFGDEMITTVLGENVRVIETAAQIMAAIIPLPLDQATVVCSPDPDSLLPMGPILNICKKRDCLKLLCLYDREKGSCILHNRRDEHHYDGSSLCT